MMTTASDPQLNTLIYDLPNEKYHGTPGTVSSTQLKDILADPEVFFEKHVAKSVEKVSIPAFDVGTYFHTSVLEPHKVLADCAVFKGVRRGATWDAFKEKNEGKAIITAAEFNSTERIVQAVRENPRAKTRLSNGAPEVSLFITLWICDGGEIWAPDFKARLHDFGWDTTFPMEPQPYQEITVKVRADYLHKDWVVDLKSTGGDAKDEGYIKNSISKYKYDLSAAFYLDLFLLVTKTVKEFVWIFASKDMGNSKVWPASPANILIGRQKYMKALLRIAEGMRTDWIFEETETVIEPNYYEREWINHLGVKF